MKKTLIIIFLFNLFVNLNAQKLYVWCPDEIIAAPRVGFLEKDTINVIFFDGRVFTSKSKINCTSENTINRLLNFIKSAYPSAYFKLIDSKYYYKNPTDNRITIKIGISSLQAAFGSDVKAGVGSVGGNFSYMVIPEGKWNGITSYFVRVYDYRGQKSVKYSKDIVKLSTKSNVRGYKTAKQCINDSYLSANQEMLFFLDESLIE